MQCKPDATEQYVKDCINEFELFESDGESFWSNSLLRRMAMKEEISQKRKKAAEARWGKKNDATAIKEDKDTKGMQMHSTSNANGMQGKESKEKERKVNNNKLRRHQNLLKKSQNENLSLLLITNLQNLQIFIQKTLDR